MTEQWERVADSEGLCPICKSCLENKYSEDEEGQEIIIQERCSNGCYVYDFELNKRIK